MITVGLLKDGLDMLKGKYKNLVFFVSCDKVFGADYWSICEIKGNKYRCHLFEYDGWEKCNDKSFKPIPNDEYIIDWETIQEGLLEFRQHLSNDWKETRISYEGGNVKLYNANDDGRSINYRSIAIYDGKNWIGLVDDFTLDFDKENEKIQQMYNQHDKIGVAEAKTTNWKEIQHFHPEGMKLPNGSHYQRGGFLYECKRNKNNFILNEGVHNNQYGMSKYRGGIIVFSTDVNAIELDRNKLLNKIKQVITTFKNRLKRQSMIHNVMNKFNTKGGEYIGAYSIGNFFKGKYVGDNGEMYNEKSLSVEINGLSSKSLLTVAEMIAQEFMQETVLVKDLNKDKIYLADTIPMPNDSILDDELDEINIEC